MTRTQLLFLLLIAFVLLLNFVTRALRRRVVRAAPRSSESKVSEIPRGAQRPPPATTPRRSSEAPRAPRTAPLPVAVRPARPQPRARAPLGGLRAVRRGVVLMTILGPCRALEPPGPPA